MTKEERIIDKTVKEIKLLEKNVEHLVSLELEPKHHKIQKAIYEAKAHHEVKKILKDAGHLEKVTDKDFEDYFKELVAEYPDFELVSEYLITD